MKNHKPVLNKPDEKIAIAALEGTLDGVWDLDYTSERIFLSDRWKKMLGFKPTELGDNPKEWFSRIHCDDLPMVECSLKQHMDGKTAHFRNEHRIKTADGSFRWFLVRGMVVQNESNTTNRIAGTISDIHEKKVQEFKLMQQLDELRFALASEKVLMDELDRKNKELTELSITDGLTGLYNHRYLQERLNYEFKRVCRYGGPLSCILIDIDRFKLLNDTYGHQFGDYVIKEIAFLLKTSSREVDICGRYGGEEFMILANLYENNAFQFASKLHKIIEMHIFEHPMKDVHVTVSAGVAEWTNEILSKQELIEHADRALYKAKNSGRNMVSTWKEKG